MFEILLDEDYKKLIGYIPIPEHDVRKAAKAEQKHTLKQVIEWGNEECLHLRVTQSNSKKECPQCWAELEKEANSG